LPDVPQGELWVNQKHVGAKTRQRPDSAPFLFPVTNPVTLRRAASLARVNPAPVFAWAGWFEANIPTSLTVFEPP
jgi:hypothetical protein